MFKLFESNASKSTKITHYPVGDQQLEIVRTTRKNSIALKCRADTPVIFVPKHYSNRQLTKVLLANQTWLMQGVTKLQQQRLSRPEVTVFKGHWGDSFDFLGQSVTLKQGELSLFKREVSSAKNRPLFSQVSVLGNQCHLVEHLNTPLQRCNAIEAFMIQTAQVYLAEHLPQLAQQIGVTYQKVGVKGYKSRWGSCHFDGRLQFNWRLWQAPPWVIEYVMVHELCHFVHLNHSKAFWALVQLHCPKTHEAKAYIKQHGQSWIQFLQKSQ
ncbi:hypothetical protein MNBD_GAMMA04-1128 [hydrothermal vent metagenome]|uniref:YgjP-like metallopeptidase domain-containing protein n=2 Tax=hydrothermal vent metagenome TaxID=652676 RepID=A0A3B0WHE6_9ZZZZ